MKIALFKNDLIQAAALGVLTSVISFMFTLIAGYLLSHTDINSKEVMLASFSIFIASSSIFHYLSEMIFKRLNHKIQEYYLSHAWGQLLYIPYVGIKRIHSTELYKMLDDYELALSSIVTLVFSMLTNLLLILFLLLFILYYYPLIAALYTSVFIVLLSIKLFTYPTLTKHRVYYLDAQGNADAFLNEALGQIHKIKTSNLENSIQKKWLALLIKSKNLLSLSSQLETKLWLIDMVSFATLILVSLYCSVSTLFLACASQLILVFEKLSTELLALTNLRIALKRLDPALRMESKAPSFPAHIQSDNIDIRLDKVSTSKLSNISMHIEAGSFVALTGASGSGKSTLFKLILGLEVNYTGTITLDNKNMNALDMHAVRQQFGVVLQTSCLFPGTIFSNISANINITLDEAWQLARIVCLDEEVNAMPMKMFTYISDNPGDSISGGQKQKILIARALATKPKILFLDEATSGLDDASQLLIFNNLQSLNMTRVVIAHRLNSIEKADKIYYLDNGHVIMSNKNL